MPERRFLLRLLSGIFIFQACVFGVGFLYCKDNGGLKACPDLKDSYEQTFAVMLSTTLALLTGNAIKE